MLLGRWRPARATLWPRLARHAASGRSGKRRAPKLQLEVPELCTAARLAGMVGQPSEAILGLASSLGEPLVSEKSPLGRELIELLALELGAEITLKQVDEHPLPPPTAAERVKLPFRAPVVTLMGHVDHGKTSLLDAFRGSSIAASEAGGITQGISAFMVPPAAGYERGVTFIDTPGHELFTRMRERGAHATDIILLICALDAGVQDTTREAIRYAREVGCPMIVAANKVDKVGAAEALPKLSQQLLEEEVMSEQFGGDVPIVPVSATKRLNLDELLEAIHLQAEMMELHAVEEGRAEGIVLESVIRQGLGIVSTVLIQRGTLRRGDHVVIGSTWGKVRVLANEIGRPIHAAGPSLPVRINGLRELPSAGDELLVVQSEARAKEVAEFRKLKAEVVSRAELAPRRGQRRRTSKLVPTILKADSAGSLEAVGEGLRHFPTSRVELKMVRSSVGSINESDIQLAKSVGATVFAFNVPIVSTAATLAAQLQIPVYQHNVIYTLMETAKRTLEEAIDPVVEEHTTGTAEVLETFTLTLNRKDRKDGMSKHTVVAGSRVIEGTATAHSLARVLRDGETVHEGRIISLRHFKQEVRSMKKGSECGMILHDYSGVSKGDRIVFFERVSRKPSLYEGEEDFKPT